MPRDRPALIRRISITFLAAYVLGGVFTSGAPGARAAAPPAWTRWQHVPGVLDVAGPRSDGSLLVAAGGRLLQLNPVSGERQPFAAGPDGYSGAGGEEPYLALSSGLSVAGAGCTFARDDLFVLQLKPAGGVLRIDANGRVHTFANVDGVDSLNGITFDTTGRFGDRLLVAGRSHSSSVVAAIDCQGSVQHITDSGPIVEGGMAVAPAGFGAFGGDLIAPDELSGNIYAILPDGSTVTVARSGLPTGQDVGVEGAGFVPPGFAGGAAYFADRSTSGNPHPGTDSLLRLDAQTLAGAGVRAGDLLVATEGGAAMEDVRCGSTCQVSQVARGDTAHGEGHVLVLAPAPGQPPSQLPTASDLGRAAFVQRWLVWGGVGAVAFLLLAAATVVAVWQRRRARRRKAPPRA